MGWMLIMGCCYTCDQLMTFNPERVPSVVVDGQREPLCRNCVERANPTRVANDLPPIVILPGAYDAEEV
jgi:hypothetical protein